VNTIIIIMCVVHNIKDFKQI